MKYLNLTKILASAAIVSLTFGACKKATVATPLGDNGQTLVKILGGGTPAATISKPIDFLPTPTVILAVEVRRDVPNETELNKTTVVTVKDDTAAVTAAGRLHMPTAWYTVAVAGGTKSGGQGGTFTITFQPGEFSKSIYVTVPNATLLNPSLVYGLGFTVMTTGQGTITEQKSAVVEIGAKNAYDGVYTVESGFVQRYSGPGPTNPICCDNLTGPLGDGKNDDVILFTTGAYTCGIPPSNQVGRLTWSYLTTPNSGVAGIDGISLTVDPSTNLVTSMATGNATFANFPGYPAKYIPSTKKFDLNWRWNPTGVCRDYQVVLKYKGPR